MASSARSFSLAFVLASMALYIPLGGSRQGHTKTLRNLGIVMFLGGLWRGVDVRRLGRVSRLAAHRARRVATVRPHAAGG